MVVSSKRCEELKEFQRFVGVEEKTLIKHCPTRWLSMRKCIIRVIDQHAALRSFFQAQKDVDDPRSKVADIFKTLDDPLLLPWLHFLKTALLPYYNFNAKFQVR